MKPNSNREYRQVPVLRVSTSEIHTAKYNNEDHLVIPVVIMKANAVIRPMYSKGPEFVPANVLAELPESINGRPVVPDHPMNGLSSANIPTILDDECFGWVFDAGINGEGDLVGNVYLSPSRAEKVGGEAPKTLEKLKAGEKVELSVGTYLTLLEESGTSPSGVEYEYVWSDLSHDHLALGLNGSQGACSNELGCGPVGSRERSKGRMLRTSKKEGDDVKFKDAVEYVQTLFKGSQEGLDNIELEQKLSSLLNDTVPAFDYLVKVYQEDRTVIYKTWPSEGDWKFYSRSYTVGDDESVTLMEDEKEVRLEESWIPVSAKSNDDVNACECGGECDECKSQVKPNSSRDEDEDSKVKSKSDKVTRKLTRKSKTQTRKGLDNNRKVSAMNEKDREKLVSTLSVNSKFTEEQLEDMDDALLEELGEKYELADEQPDTKVETKVETTKPNTTDVAPSDEPAELTEDQWLASQPTFIQEQWKEQKAAVEERKATRAAKKAELVKSLKANTDVYSDDELKAMELEQVEKLCRALKVNTPKPNFAHQGLPSPAISDNNDDEIPAPPDLAKFNAARAAGKTRDEAMEIARAS